MSRPRSGIGAELAPLVLILACVAGSLALIVSAHRRVSPRPIAKPAVALAVVEAAAAPGPKPAPVVELPDPEEPDPPAAPTPEDPTPKALAKLTSAEAEQLLEASRADRKAAALEAARKAALVESEKWRRRESLVRLQLNSLDSKVKTLEVRADELALERDALERERDARKAMVAQERSRPGQAILPHRGQNGTWRRPIVVECGNGMAILRPQGLGFGLLELASGFGPASNPFVAAVAREAIRIQGSHSPDGQAVVPYIFFLVRPDGIRPYYEARGRLEPLGITFGYELADMDWEVDFPDLDDVKTWDGSAPSRPEGPDPLARLAAPGRPPGGVSAEDEDLSPFESSRTGRSAAARADGPGGEFTWPSRSRALDGGSGTASRRAAVGTGTGTNPGGGNVRGGRLSGAPSGGTAPQATNGDGPQGSGGRDPGGPSGLTGGTGAGPDPLAGPGSPSAAASGEPRELSLGDGPIAPVGSVRPIPAGLSRGRNAATAPAKPSRPGRAEPSGDVPAVSVGAEAPADGPQAGKDDPANTMVWPPKTGGSPRGNPDDRQPSADGEGAASPDRSPSSRRLGPFARPLAMGLDSTSSPESSGTPNPSADADPSRPDGTGTPRSGGTAGTAPGRKTTTSPSDARRVGQGGPPGVSPPSGSIGIGAGLPASLSGLASAAGTPPGGSSKPSAMPELPPSSVVDRRFEVVVVCGARGVIVQPGAYRVTADALKDRDGLLKKQIVALVKARRAADPKTTIEPRVRFLIQPGGDKTFWAARSQFLLSGLDWPMSTQVADPDHLTILPSESW